jgi:Zn-dependent peptidase ImmA (M78 family)/transcriptional regulator with XRE-family HTH domain
MIGGRIKLARESCGYSLRDLEDQIGHLVSAQAIGKYERNEMMPSSNVLLALAKALGVSVDFLLNEEEVSLESVDFRHIPSGGAREHRSVSALVLDAAQRYLELERLFPDTAKAWRAPHAQEFTIGKIEDAEFAASKLRQIWKLGIDPIDSITELLEEQGIKIVHLSLPPEVSGSKAFASSAADDSIALIVVNKDDNGERQRFTMAHELGHLLLQPVDLDHKQCEKAADWFAGAFLMAKEMVERVVGKSRRAITYGELVAAKRVFKVSLAALVVRLKQLGIIAKAVFGQIWGYLVKTGLTAKNAPEPSPIQPEVPGRAQRLALRGVAEQAISESRAAELLRISRRELERLLDPVAVLGA